MRKILFLIVALAGIMLLTQAAFAGSDINIVDNGGFDQGGANWDASGSVFFTVDQGVSDKWSDPSFAYDPAGAGGEGGYLRQVVNASASSNWVAGAGSMTGNLSFWDYSTGTGGVKVGFGWWDSTTIGKPGPGANPDHYVILPTIYTSPDAWSPVTVTYDWTGRAGSNNPKWVALEFYFMNVSGTANESGVDEVSFNATSNVPEPSSLIGMAGVLTGLAGTMIRRRRN